MFGLDIDTLRNIRSCFSGLPNIEKVTLYGSRARGNYKTGSDIDITLLGKDLRLDNSVYPLQDLLEELYLPYKFDISIFKDLESDDIIEHILRVGKIFYQKERSLPQGWEEKRLDEVCDIKPTKNEARLRLKATDKVSFLPMKDLGIGIKNAAPKQERILSEVEGSYTYFAEGDILLAKITPCFENGKLGIAQNLVNGIGFGSSEYIIFRSNNKLFNEYLFYFFSQEVFRLKGAKRMTGTAGQKRVSKNFIEAIPIPLPPLSEQKRIVAKLDKLFAAIDKARANAEKNLSNAKELFQSYLDGIFASPGKDWEEKRLGEVCEKVAKIKREKMSKTDEFKYVDIGGIDNTTNRIISHKIYSWEEAPSRAQQIIKQGDILFSTVRTYLKNTAQVKNKIYDNEICSSGFTVIRSKRDILNPDYIFYFSISEYFIQHLNKLQTGASYPAIRDKDVFTQTIPPPPSL